MVEICEIHDIVRARYVWWFVRARSSLVPKRNEWKILRRREITILTGLKSLLNGPIYDLFIFFMLLSLLSLSLCVFFSFRYSLFSCLLLFSRTLFTHFEFPACYFCWSCRCCCCTIQCLFIYSSTVENCACIAFSLPNFVCESTYYSFLISCHFIFISCVYFGENDVCPKSFGIYAIWNGADKCRHCLIVLKNLCNNVCWLLFFLLAFVAKHL